MYKWTLANRKFNALFFGLAGGLAGAIIMGLVAYATPAPNTGSDPFFIATASAFGFGNLAWAIGWLLHVITGMAIGIVFGIMSTSRALRTQKVSNKMIAGIVVGLVAWVALFVPMMLLITPEATSTQSLSSGLVLNITFGLILVVVFGFGQSFALVEPHIDIFRCVICGFSAPSEEEVEAHKRTIHSSPERLVQKPIET